MRDKPNPFHAELPLPQSWVEEYCANRMSDTSVPTGLAGTVYFSYFPRGKFMDTLTDRGVNFEEVENDLSGGTFVERLKSQDSVPRFRLLGSSFEVRVRQAQGEKTSLPVAIVYQIDLLQHIGRQRGLVPVRVHFTPIHDEEHCDLERLYEDWRNLSNEAWDTLATGSRQQEIAVRSGLHAVARRRYGALRSLMQLLEQRAEVEQAAKAVGVVADEAAEEDGRQTQGDDAELQACLRVQLNECSGSFREDCLVEIARDGEQRSWRTRVREVDEGVLVMEPLDDAEFSSGQQVCITLVPRFAMRQHSFALRKFLNEEVEGNWEDLAGLLCQPASLHLDPAPMPVRFFCDEDAHARPLNEEQRKAVAAALASPHTFFVQGPPGTGKTTVIAELVQQLIERGERVLLLAPTHVAVDEVLRRVGHKDGVLALRLTHDDGKVRDDLRCFTLRSAGLQFVRAIRRPSTSRARGWERQVTALTDELAAIARLEQATGRLRPVAEARDHAIQAEQQRRTELSTWQQQHRKELHKLAADLAELSPRIVAQAMALRDAAAREEAARKALADEMLLLQELLDATRNINAAVQSRDQATAHEAATQERLRTWLEQHRRTAQQLAVDLEANTLRQQQLAVEVPVSLAKEQEIDGHLQAAARQRGFFGRLLDSVDFLGFGTVGELRLNHRKARDQRQALESELSALREKHAKLAQQQQQLAADGPRMQQTLEQACDQAHQARESTVESCRHASKTWEQAFENAAGTVRAASEDLVGFEQRLSQSINEPVQCAELLGASGLGRGTELQQQLQQATSRRECVEQELSTVQKQHSELTHRQQQLTTQGPVQEQALQQAFAQASEERERADQDDKLADEQWRQALRALGYDRQPTAQDLADRHKKAITRREAIGHYPELEQRWFELTGMAQADGQDAVEQIAKQIGDDLLRAANLVCATTVGIAGRAGEFVRGADFDTLIVDEASRVTDSEFLIGAVRARRWVLVGDEKQLPPYVEQDDECHLHALAALHRVERGATKDLEIAVRDLAELWQEDEELHQFRQASVLQAAQQMQAKGTWEREYRDTFEEAHKHFQSLGDNADRELLQTMIYYLVRSLFERCVAECPAVLKQRLVVQRRMIDAIAVIVRDPIYGGDYRTPDEADLRMCGVTPLTTRTFQRPVVFLDTTAHGRRAWEQQAGNGFTNPLECDWVVSACRSYERDLRSRNDQPVSVSILSFYRAQAREIRKRLGAPLYGGFHKLRFQVIDAIDRIQGQESDLVFITFCRTHSGQPSPQFGQWLQDLRRLNVACTRAHRALVLVGNKRMLGRLCASEEAKAFYAHLIKLFDGGGPDWLVLQDFK